MVLSLFALLALSPQRSILLFVLVAGVNTELFFVALATPNGLTLKLHQKFSHFGIPVASSGSGKSQRHSAF
jgi:hypothetical protein